MSAGAARPTPPGERLAFLDLLRGFALFGILVVNFPLMASPYEAQYGTLAWWTGGVDQAAHAFIRVFFEGTFYVIFSVLFATGFHRLLTSGGEADRSRFRRYGRRLAGLAVLGGLHLSLLWYGDVLLLYAVAGVILLAFRGRKDGTLLVWIGLLVVVPLLMYGALVPLSAWVESGEGMDAYTVDARLLYSSVVEGYRSDDFARVRAMSRYEFERALGALVLFFPQIVTAMLAGLLLARKGVLTDPAQHPRFYRGALTIGLPVALVCKGAYAWGAHHMGLAFDGWTWATIAAFTVGGPALSWVYAALLLRMRESNALVGLRQAIALTGRMALSHYLLQSLVVTSLMYGYGLGWYGSVGIAQGFLVCVVIYAVQLMVSVIWFRHFRHGPVEAVLRRWTYWRWDV